MSAQIRFADDAWKTTATSDVRHIVAVVSQKASLSGQHLRSQRAGYVQLPRSESARSLACSDREICGVPRAMQFCLRTLWHLSRQAPLKKSWCRCQIWSNLDFPHIKTPGCRSLSLRRRGPIRPSGLPSFLRGVWVAGETAFARAESRSVFAQSIDYLLHFLVVQVVHIPCIPVGTSSAMLS